jgi:NifU-like protein involved in Fe-S cluster formation
MELSDLYSEKILEIAGNQPRPGRLDNPSASARRVSRVCGSHIEVDITVSNGMIVDYGHDLSACALGQTSTAIVAANIAGTPVGEFRALRDNMVDMLKHEGAPPTGKWDSLKYLQPVRDYPQRYTSTMLVFDAVVDALDKLEKAEASESVAAKV